MNLNGENVCKLVVYVVLIYCGLKLLQDNYDIGLGGVFKSIEGLTNGAPANGAPANGAPANGAPANGAPANGVPPTGVPGAPVPIKAAEPLGSNESPGPAMGLGRAPSTCYPQPALSAQDLLPKEDSAAIQEFNQVQPAGEGILQGVNMLDAGFHVGVNTVGQSLRNGNQQLRSEPPNPQVQVSPWMMSTIGPDLMRRPLEDGEGCTPDLAQGNLWKPGAQAGSA